MKLYRVSFDGQPSFVARSFSDAIEVWNQKGWCRVPDRLTLSVSELQRLDEAMRAAHLRDRLSVCGCSKQSLRVCVSCAEVTCTCQRAKGGCRCSPEPAK